MNETEQQQQPPYDQFTTVYSFYDVVQFVCMTLGIPGNILSAIVWLRLHVASKNSSAVYLAAIAINDLVFLLKKLILTNINFCVDWLCYCSLFIYLSTSTLEPLLVLGFPVERLIAISYPLQVLCCIRLQGGPKK